MLFWEFIWTSHDPRVQSHIRSSKMSKINTELPAIPPQLSRNMEKTNDTSEKLIRCLCAPPGGRYLLIASFRKLILNEWTKKLLPKTREAALGPRRPLSEMTEDQIYDIKKALLEDTDVHLEVACYYDKTLQHKADLIRHQHSVEENVHVPQAHGSGI